MLAVTNNNSFETADSLVSVQIAYSRKYFIANHTFGHFYYDIIFLFLIDKFSCTRIAMEMSSILPLYI
jgi:hypothetical protein